MSEETAALNLRALALRALRPQFAIPLAVAVVLLGFLGLREYQRSARARWVRDQAVPEIRRLLDDNEFRPAFRLIRQAEAILPQDRALKQTLEDATFEVSFATNPPGADVWATGYNPDDNDWFYLGTTPFRTKMLPPGYYRLRVAKMGFRTILGAGGVPGLPLQFDLDAEGSIPSDMVRVPGGAPVIDGLDAKVASFLIDRLEVTNRQFKQFVDSRGYEKQEYWKQDFVKNGRKLSWEEAMYLLRESTGRPGPSTWELGEYPQGRDDYPVNGVSWYEAAAYAEFSGKQLPTIYRWQQAAAPGYFADVTSKVPKGPRPWYEPARAGPEPAKLLNSVGIILIEALAGRLQVCGVVSIQAAVKLKHFI